ncbi:hypothetical protein C7B76_31035 [filamentous cyanobacterium CCP2]|nr:hypothetical protein C7B76_31035 [filamentous cyanobacterium CCP2]
MREVEQWSELAERCLWLELWGLQRIVNLVSIFSRGGRGSLWKKSGGKECKCNFFGVDRYENLSIMAIVEKFG